MKNTPAISHINNKNIGTRLILHVVASIVFVVLALLSYEKINQENKKQSQISEVTRELSRYQAKLETLVNKNLELAQGLVAYISLNPNLSQAEFYRFTHNLLAKNHQIKNIGAAKDLIITHMYPVEGNEKAIGLDYRTLEYQKHSVLQALSLNKVIIAGPFELVQGGQALIAQKPIVINQSKQIWGVASVVLNYQKMLALSGIEHQKNLAISLQGKDALGSQGEVFYGDPSVIHNSPVKLKVSLPHGEWIIAAEPIEGWTTITINKTMWLSSFTLLFVWILLLVQQANNKRLHAISLENLIESEEKFRNIFSSHNAIMMMIDKESGRIIDANDAAAKFYGYSKAELKQRTIQQINQLSPEEISAKIALAIKTKQNYFVFPHQLADGSIRQVEVHSSPIKLTHSTLLYSIIHDVTDRVESEKTLKLNAKVFENSKEGVLITNEFNQIISINHAFTDITGYSEQEVIHKNPSILSSGKHPETFYQTMYQAIKEQGFWHGEIWNRKKNGGLYPQLLSISKLENELQQITNYVAVFSDISQLKRSEKRLQKLAHFDVLTHLPNRLLLMTRIEHAIDKIKRNNKDKLGVLFLDLDQFKMINDSLGHVVGDELLCQVAERLTQRIRKEDTVARLGGDEFIVLIENVQQASDLITIAQDIIEDLERPFILSVTEAHISTSIGIALYPDDTLNIEKIISYADAAMYKAKENGRNTYAFYTDSITKEAEYKLQTMYQLKKAISSNELELYYQPQVNLNSGEIIGAEALLRWNHPSGLITPDNFIPLAEEKGLIHNITLWVIEQGCTQLKVWQDMGLGLTLSLNISANDWVTPDFYSNVASIIQRTGVNPHLLEFELTENSIMDKAESVLTILKKIKALGITLALDDFGTGHSSLSYLKHFPINKLKIDKSFVMDLEKNPSDKMIIATIIDMAKNFNLQVIAEGVEQESQINYLRLLDCDMGQGYFYGKPVPVAKFQEALPPLLFET